MNKPEEKKPIEAIITSEEVPVEAVAAKVITPQPFSVKGRPSELAVIEEQRKKVKRIEGKIEDAKKELAIAKKKLKLLEQAYSLSN